MHNLLLTGSIPLKVNIYNVTLEKKDPSYCVIETNRNDWLYILQNHVPCNMMERLQNVSYNHENHNPITMHKVLPSQ
jgi:hypothetical protein